MNHDTLVWWEKLPIVGLFAAQGLYVWRWYVGPEITPLALVVMLAGIAAVAAIDGAMVATVAGMRQGRRSKASYAAIVVTASFGAAVALDLYGAIMLVSAWLHAGFALTIVCYLLHLAAPRATSAQERAVDADTVAQWEAHVAHLEAQVAHRDEAVALLEAQVAHAEGERATLRHTVARLEADAARRGTEEAERGILYHNQRYTLAQLSEATGISGTTLRRKLAQIGTQVSAAD
jgi:hypothetical protein